MATKRICTFILICLAFPSLLMGARRADRQFLEDGDRLRIRVFNRRGELEYDLRETVRQGALVLPLVGPMKVSDLGVQRFRRQLRDAFGARWIREPYVHVVLERNAHVLVKGPFLPRMIEVLEGASLFEALDRLGRTEACRTLRLHRGRMVQEFEVAALVRGYERRGTMVGMRDGDVLELIP